MTSAVDFKTPCQPTWCPGCGDFGIWGAIKNAVSKLQWGPSDFILVYGIGCHGHMVNFLKSYAIETLHGRPIPVAEGIRMANHSLPVLVVAGDGDTFGEGTNHFVHAARRNIDITVILHDNQVYGLTTGQTAPTAQKGFRSKSSPDGVIEEPVNPLAIALSAGASFVARGFAGDIVGTTNLLVEGITHSGFSFLDIFQPCVTFNRVNTFQWYRDHVAALPSEYVPNDRAEAYKKALEWGEKIPTGVFYKEEKPTYEAQIPVLGERPLIHTAFPTEEEITVLFDEFV